MSHHKNEAGILIEFDDSITPPQLGPRPPSDVTLRYRLVNDAFTDETCPPPGPLLDRLHALAVEEAARQRTGRPSGALLNVLENLAVILRKRGEDDSHVHCEIDGLR